MRLIGIAVVLALGLTLAPLATEGQQAWKVPRIGYLSAGALTTAPTFENAFRQGLRELGYVEGRNIAIEYQWAEGKYERLPELAAELVRLKVDVILALTTPAAQAAKAATRTIPIAFTLVADPVASGLAASLARPSGNITGLPSISSEIIGKQLELLKETVPCVSRVAVLQNPDASSHPFMVREAADALLVLADPFFRTHRAGIADFAAKSRLPSVSGEREQTEASRLDMFRRAATYVDKILKGAKPADLPVEQPTKFELVVNLKTAKTFSGSCQATFF
jgi:putative ABC transport system substrate-binding protein